MSIVHKTIRTELTLLKICTVFLEQKGMDKMSRKINYLSIILIMFLFVSCGSDKEFTISVANDSVVNYIDEIVSIPVKEVIGIDVNKAAAFIDGKQLESQLVDINNDGKVDNFAFLLDLDANQTKSISIRETKSKRNFKQRVHAEISEKRDYKLVDGVYTGGKFVPVKRTKIPKGHIDHNLYYKCEGPCWESEKVAYRFYIDQRNATDIYGKKVSEMVLPNVGHTYNKFGNEMYHTMQDWGMDIFKVGNSLGMGSFAALVDGKVEMLTKRDSVICTITNDGPIYASVNTKYYGWEFGNQKIEIIDATHSIVAGSRLTKCNVSISGNYYTYCTGIAKHNGTEFTKSNNKNGWNYIALWGNQTSVNDNLGIALFYNNLNSTITEDELSYIVSLKPNDGKIKYYYAACWEQELNGIKTEEKFIEYLNEEIVKLNKPLKTKIFK